MKKIIKILLTIFLFINFLGFMLVTFTPGKKKCTKDIEPPERYASRVSDTRIEFFAITGISYSMYLGTYTALYFLENKRCFKK